MLWYTANEMYVVCIHFNLAMCKFKPNAERMGMSMKLLQSEVTEKDTCSCCIYSNGGTTGD